MSSHPLDGNKFTLSHLLNEARENEERRHKERLFEVRHMHPRWPGGKSYKRPSRNEWWYEQRRFEAFIGREVEDAFARGFLVGAQHRVAVSGEDVAP